METTPESHPRIHRNTAMNDPIALRRLARLGTRAAILCGLATLLLGCEPADPGGGPSYGSGRQGGGGVAAFPAAFAEADREAAALL